MELPSFKGQGKGANETILMPQTEVGCQLDQLVKDILSIDSHA